METGEHHGSRIVIGRPPMPLVMKLWVVTGLILTVVMIAGPFFGAPVLLLGLLLPVQLSFVFRKWRKIGLTAWDHRLVVYNWKGPVSLDRDDIRGFEISTPSAAFRREEDSGKWSPWLWNGPTVHAIYHDGTLVPLLATFRRRRDPSLEANLAQLEAWFHPPAM